MGEGSHGFGLVVDVVVVIGQSGKSEGKSRLFIFGEKQSNSMLG